MRGMEWKLIEDAPKDGTELLLFIPEQSYRRKKDRVLCKGVQWIAIGYWYFPRPEDNIKKEYMHDLYMKHDGWWTSGYKRKNPIGGRPTHFMLLPNIPTQGNIHAN